jgi:hypothetical protein
MCSNTESGCDGHVKEEKHVVTGSSDQTFWQRVSRLQWASKHYNSYDVLTEYLLSQILYETREEIPDV